MELSWKNFCLPYRIRGFRNKGGLLTLFWSFSGFLLINYVFQKKHPGMMYGLVISIIFYPFAGWLADAYFGRYKVIRNSMRIVLALVLTYNYVLVICSYCWSGGKCGDSNGSLLQRVIFYGSDVIGGIALLGMAGFQANLLQLGIDQFADASSIEISSYINWYVWTIFLSKLFVTYTQVCNQQEVLSFASASVFLTISVVSDIFLNHWLVKEPAVYNPLKLIYLVLRYAMKNKYPLRSAYSYWEEKRYFRIELGKAKYGGPFTTEQVEDVKTFFRVFLIITVASIIMGLFIILDNAFIDLVKHYRNDHSGKCYELQSVERLASILVVGYIPLLEFVLYPLFRKCSLCAKFGIMYRFLLGIFLLSIYEIYIMSMEAVAVSSFHNATCFVAFDNRSQEFKYSLHVPVDMDYKWLMPAKIFSAGSMYLLITSGIEFVCAQAPYSMKGLFSGIVYCLSGITASIAFGLWEWIIQHVKKLEDKHFLNYTCGVWFHFLAFSFTFFLLCIGFALVKWYSFRQRDEDIHNEQSFAVDYFNRYNMTSKS